MALTKNDPQPPAPGDVQFRVEFADGPSETLNGSYEFESGGVLFIRESAGGGYIHRHYAPSVWRLVKETVTEF